MTLQEQYDKLVPYIGSQVKVVLLNDQGMNQLYDASIKNVRLGPTRIYIDLNEFTNYTCDSNLVGVIKDSKFVHLIDL